MMMQEHRILAYRILQSGASTEVSQKIWESV